MKYTQGFRAEDPLHSSSPPLYLFLLKLIMCLLLFVSILVAKPSYCPLHCPLCCLELWARDGVCRITSCDSHINSSKYMYLFNFTVFQTHLSDYDGMPILTRQLWVAVSSYLEPPVPNPQASPKSCPLLPRLTPNLVVASHVSMPHPSNPFEWTHVFNYFTAKVSIQFGNF